MAKTLEEAQHASEKLEKKGGKASTHKVDTVSAKLESATQQWESQAPYIFESLQALDEMRVNHLRDVLTQYQTHEADCAQRVQDTTAETLAQVIEVSTEAEVLGFASRATAGKPRVPTLDSTRRSSTAETYASTAPPSTGGSAALAPPSALQPTPPESQRDGQPSPTPAAPEPAPEHKPGECSVSSRLSTVGMATNPFRLQVAPLRHAFWRTPTAECPWRLRVIASKGGFIYLWPSWKQRWTRRLTTGFVQQPS